VVIQDLGLKWSVAHTVSLNSVNLIIHVFALHDHHAVFSLDVLHSSDSYKFGFLREGSITVWGSDMEFRDHIVIAWLPVFAWWFCQTTDCRHLLILSCVLENKVILDIFDVTTLKIFLNLVISWLGIGQTVVNIWWLIRIVKFLQKLLLLNMIKGLLRRYSVPFLNLRLASE